MTARNGQAESVASMVKAVTVPDEKATQCPTR